VDSKLLATKDSRLLYKEPATNNSVKVFYLSTDAKENCFKKNIKIYFERVSTCFGAITIIREGTFELAKVTVVKIIN
jgi:putative transposon-encoded protein